jgi:hypothetical protein
MRLNAEFTHRNNLYKIVGVEVVYFSHSLRLIVICEDFNIYMISLAVLVKHFPYKKVTTRKTVDKLLSRVRRSIFVSMDQIEKGTIKWKYNELFSARLEEVIEKLEKEQISKLLAPFGKTE